MKTLVIGIPGLGGEALFEDERLENFIRLAELGCYGRLAGDQVFPASIGDPAFGMQFAPQGEVIYLTGQPAAVSAGNEDLPANLDAELGRILEILDDDTAVLVLNEHSQTATAAKDYVRDFILAFPNIPLQGEIEGATLPDLSATLLELRGVPTPEGLAGKSLLEGLAWTVEDSAQPAAGLSTEEEELLRERLSGLGYIG